MVHCHIASSQNSFFSNPIDSPLYLSGNFCQLRDNHFHYGLDIPTNNEEGWCVRAVADGYISRIFVASYGYGNALFVTHANGLTSVYAHLRNFNEKINDYTIQQHYKRQSNSLDIFLQKNILKVKKGDIIAYSGNSGGSSGPHLHLEIRNAQNELLNPQYFFNVPDTMPPLIGKIIICSDKNNFTYLMFDSLIHDTFYVPSGSIEIEAEIFDRMIFPQNKMNVKKYSLYINNEKYFECVFDKYSFDKNKFVNLHFDYDYYWDNGIRLQKLFTEKQNRCRFYNSEKNIFLRKKETVNCEIIAEDFNKKTIKRNFFISENVGLGYATPPRFWDSEGMFKWREIIPNKSQIIFSDSGNTKLEFPSDNFSDTSVISIEKSGNNVRIIGDMGTHQPFLIPPTLYIKKENDINVSDNSKLLIAYKTSDSNSSPLGGTFENGWVKTKINLPGEYIILADSVSPKLNFDSSDASAFYFSVTDNLTGIGYCRATVDSKFALVSFDAKIGKIIYSKNKFSPKGKHKLKIFVSDRKQNYTTFQKEIDW